MDDETENQASHQHVAKRSLHDVAEPQQRNGWFETPHVNLNLVLATGFDNQVGFLMCFTAPPLLCLLRNMVDQIGG